MEVLLLASPASAQRLDFLAFVFPDFFAAFLTFFTAFFSLLHRFLCRLFGCFFPGSLFFLTAGIAVGAGIGAGVTFELAATARAQALALGRSGRCVLGCSGDGGLLDRRPCCRRLARAPVLY